MKKSKRARASRSPQLQLSQLRMKPLAIVVAMCCSGAAMAAEPAAADAGANDNVEEVVVTGLRQSLVTSETIKRDTAGVVDAITSEDIGKFPDTNLAESIQRVPGVTIDRRITKARA